MNVLCICKNIYNICQLCCEDKTKTIPRKNILSLTGLKLSQLGYNVPYGINARGHKCYSVPQLIVRAKKCHEKEGNLKRMATLKVFIKSWKQNIEQNKKNTPIKNKIIDNLRTIFEKYDYPVDFDSQEVQKILKHGFAKYDISDPDIVDILTSAINKYSEEKIRESNLYKKMLDGLGESGIKYCKQLKNRKNYKNVYNDYINGIINITLDEAFNLIRVDYVVIEQKKSRIAVLRPMIKDYFTNNGNERLFKVIDQHKLYKSYVNGENNDSTDVIFKKITDSIDPIINKYNEYLIIKKQSDKMKSELQNMIPNVNLYNLV
jgi:hypothetical protein